MKLTFIELSVFMRQIDRLGKPFSDELLASIEDDLLKDAKRGDVIQGTGGARKARAGDPGRQKGKRGGFRYIYVYFEEFSQIYLLLFYGKDAKADLNKNDKQMIAASIARTRELLKRGIK